LDRFAPILAPRLVGVRFASFEPRHAVGPPLILLKQSFLI
jgi:hypothetical protein